MWAAWGMALEQARHWREKSVVPDQQYWAVAKTQTQRETWAAAQLESRGFQVFLPRLEMRRTVAPLFVGYRFVLVVDGHWLGLDRTFGVCSTIKFGLLPARCPEPIQLLASFVFRLSLRREHSGAEIACASSPASSPRSRASTAA
jgi:hypothetical protein